MNDETQTDDVTRAPDPIARTAVAVLEEAQLIRRRNDAACPRTERALIDCILEAWRNHEIATPHDGLHVAGAAVSHITDMMLTNLDHARRTPLAPGPTSHAA